MPGSINITAKDNSLEINNLAHLKNLYVSYSRTLPQGMHNINNNYYLAVPNGWEGRLWHYNWWVGRFYWEGQDDLKKKDGNENQKFGDKGLNCNDVDRDRYHKYHQKEEELTIHDKLLIDFGPATNYGEEDWEREIVIDERETDIILKLKIVASGTINLKMFPNAPNSPRKVIVDYGDGSSGEFNSGVASHSYTGSGPYILKVKSIQGSTVHQNLYSITKNYWEEPNNFIEVSNPNMISCIAFNKNVPDSILPIPYILNFKGLNLQLLHLDYYGDMLKDRRVMFINCNIDEVVCWHRGRAAYIWTQNSTIGTYHLATNIDTIYIVGQNKVMYGDRCYMDAYANHFKNSNTPTVVCCHSDRPLNIYGYSYDRDICDYSNPSIIFKVRASLVSHMQSLYPMLTFTSL